MNPYTHHQLSIEICASEVMARSVAAASIDAKMENTHVLRSGIKRWLSEVPAALRAGENTVPASTALTQARIACMNVASAMAMVPNRSRDVVAAAEDHFARYFAPILSRLHETNSLYDTPIVLLGPATSTVGPNKLAMTLPPTFSPAFQPISRASPNVESDEQNAASP